MDPVYYSENEVLVDTAAIASTLLPVREGMIIHTLGYLSAYDGNHGTYHYNPTITGSASQELIKLNGGRPGGLQLRTAAAGAGTAAEPTGISYSALLSQKNAGTMIPYNFYKLTDIPVNLFTDTASTISPVVISRGSLTTGQMSQLQTLVGTTLFALHFGTAVLNSFAMFDTALGVYRKITLSNGTLIPSNYP